MVENPVLTTGHPANSVWTAGQGSNKLSTTMVNFSAVVGCGNRSDREKGVGFLRLPTVITHQREKSHDLSKKRRDLWLVRIHREDLGPEKYPYTCNCSRHGYNG